MCVYSSLVGIPRQTTAPFVNPPAYFGVLTKTRQKYDDFFFLLKTGFGTFPGAFGTFNRFIYTTKRS